MARAEECEEAETRRCWVPNAEFPDVPCCVGVGTCLSCSLCKEVGEVAEGRGRCGGRVHAHTLRRRCVGVVVDVLLKKTVVSPPPESVEGVCEAYNGQKMNDKSGL